MRWAVETCDIVRLDHFRGFEAYWEIPADEPTAVHGHWVKGPNVRLFHRVAECAGQAAVHRRRPGAHHAEVHELRKKLDIPGMKVLQFGFGNRGAHIYLPHQYEPNSVVYTGTHDNDTTWAGGRTAQPKKRRARPRPIWASSEDVMPGLLSGPPSLRWPIWPLFRCRMCWDSDSDARMNVPSETLEAGLGGCGRER